MPTSPVELTRTQILAFRRRAGALDERLPPGARSLRQAAWAGLTDSVPRAALLSIHARVEGAWTSRVWPGAVLVAGEIVGTWRRAQANLSVHPWRRLTRAERDAVEAEARSLPLPVEGQISVRWSG